MSIHKYIILLAKISWFSVLYNKKWDTHTLFGNSEYLYKSMMMTLPILVVSVVVVVVVAKGTREAMIRPRIL